MLWKWKSSKNLQKLGTFHSFINKVSLIRGHSTKVFGKCTLFCFSKNRAQLWDSRHHMNCEKNNPQVSRNFSSKSWSFLNAQKSFDDETHWNVPRSSHSLVWNDGSEHQLPHAVWYQAIMPLTQNTYLLKTIVTYNSAPNFFSITKPSWSTEQSSIRWSSGKLQYLRQWWKLANANTIIIKCRNLFFYLNNAIGRNWKLQKQKVAKKLL